ncbi:BTAD domain-containing putative transcriptional regulator [Sphaerisporangium sp. NPDC088356]|uniref:AfsR/SARP family transcriptional regulator n=1 Tax=Sphaerisporangium sp. NPDC088356 TaxID=3154871 RepID=UPI0034227F65
MEFRIMGALEVRDGAEDHTPTVPKHRDLLALFLLNARRPLTAGRLRQLLWPREDGDRSDSLIRGYIGRLRQLLGKDVITTVSGTYTLAIEDHQVDVGRFRRLVHEGLTGRDVGKLREALSLWRGPVLADVDPDAQRWIETRRLREELEELRLLALERRIGLDLEAGHHRMLLAELRMLVAQHPLWQSLRALYMLALYRSGRRVDALAAYTALRDHLDDGHAIEPDPDLQLLYHRMLHDDVMLHVSAGPPVLLPCDVAHFTGRAHLLDQLISGLVVVHGQAGVGKSALAVHAAWLHRDRFPDGILYADLRESTRPAAILEDFLRWLGCPAQAVPAGFDQRQKLLRTYTANRRMLVLLDNAADESQVRPLLTSCPTVVTSRSALGGLTGAARVPLGMLDDDEACVLLVKLIGKERADDEGVRKVVRFCGGLPIALRVAGSRLAARPGWTPGYLAGLLEDESRRLDRLHSGDQTVRSVYAIGYDGLSRETRRLLRLLGTLSAPDVADWAVQIFGDQADALLDAGLLEAHTVDVAGQVRYRLHDLTRLFARERLMEEDGVQVVRAALAKLQALAVARLQTSRFTLVSSAPSPGNFATRDIKESVEWLAAERAFLVCLVDDLHGVVLDDGAWRLAHLLVPFLERWRFLDDWHQVCETGLKAARRTGDVRAEALILRDKGDLHRAERRWDEALDLLTRALDMLRREGRSRDVAHTQRRLGQVLLDQGRLGEAERTLTECLHALGGSASGTAEALQALGTVLHRARRPEEAADRLAVAAEHFAGLGDRHRHTDTLLELASVRLAQGRVPQARECAEKARGIAVRLGDRLLDARALLALAWVNHAEGAGGLAREMAEEALKAFDSVGDEQGREAALVLLSSRPGDGPSAFGRQGGR